MSEEKKFKKLEDLDRSWHMCNDIMPHALGQYRVVARVKENQKVVIGTVTFMPQRGWDIEGYDRVFAWKGNPDDDILDYVKTLL